MTSFQQSAPGAKSSKFVNVNPLDPFIKPFESDDIAEQSALAESLNRRLENHVAMNQQRVDHNQGQSALPYQTPSSSGDQKTHHEASMLQSLSRPKQTVGDDNDGDDSDLDDSDFDDDPVLNSIRERRMQELRMAQKKEGANLAKGHGDYRTISQDEFLPECLETSSEFVAVHFFHNQFERCKIMDHHIRIVAERYTTCKFVRVDAEKAPFFVHKLQVRTLPTLLVFEKGQVLDRLIGFDGLKSSTKDPDQWKTCQLLAWLSLTGAIDYDPSDDDDDNDEEENVSNGVKHMQLQHRSLYANRCSTAFEDD